MGRWDTQDDNSNAVTKVSSDGFDRKSQTPVASEFVIEQKGPGGEHVHLGFDENGNQLFESRR